MIGGKAPNEVSVQQIYLEQERVDFLALFLRRLPEHRPTLSRSRGCDREQGAQRRSADVSAGRGGDCGFIQASEVMISTSPDATARVVQGVITGVGFIGGGALLKHGSFVHGTATAASIRAIGTAVALGGYDVAIVISIFTFPNIEAASRLMK